MFDLDLTMLLQEVGTRDEYFSRFDPHEEHDAFRRAEQRLEERHREKVSKVRVWRLILILWEAWG